MRQKFYLLMAGLLLLASCEGSRTRKMIDTVDHAIDSHNEGDSTELVVLVVAGIIVGCIWLYLNRNKLK